jgi:hypothetical protein
MVHPPHARRILRFHPLSSSRQPTIGSIRRHGYRLADTCIPAAGSFSASRAEWGARLPALHVRQRGWEVGLRNMWIASGWMSRWKNRWKKRWMNRPDGSRLTLFEWAVVVPAVPCS